MARWRLADSGEGLLQVDDGFDLREPEVGGGKRWELAEALGQLLLLLQPGEECLGAMEGEDVTTARVGIKAVGEASFAAGAFVAEGEWGFPRGQSRGNAANVFGGLLLNADKGMTFRFCLDRAKGFGVNVKRVVGFAWGAFASRL